MSYQLPGAGVAGSGTNGQIAFWTGPTTLSGESALFWSATDDRLGIGVGSSPQTPLDVLANLSAVAQQWRENAGAARVQLQVPSSFGQIGTSSNHDFALLSNNTQRINIEAGGAVALGVVGVAQGQLHIRAINATTIGLVVESAASPTAHLLEVRRAATPVLQATSSGALIHTTQPRTSGSARYHQTLTPADTSLASDTESIGVQIGGTAAAATVTRQFLAGAGSFTLQRETVCVHPTYAFTAADTITTAATLAITGAPVAGLNATLTNRYALLVEDGASAFQRQAAAAPTDAAIYIEGVNGSTFAVASWRVNGTERFRVRADSANVVIGPTFAGGSVFYGTDGQPSAHRFVVQSGAEALTTLWDGTTHNVGVNKSGSIGAQLHIVSTSASKIACRIDSAATPTAAIAQITNNGVAGWEFWGDYWQIQKEATADPGTARLSAGDHFAIYRKNDKLVVAYNNAGTITYLTIPLDGATTTWTQSTTAP